MQRSIEPPVYRCQHFAEPIEIDGDIFKPVWQDVPLIELKLADGQGAPAQTTTVRSCWDGANLYFAFECQDSDIRATLTQRDALLWREEVVEAFIAPEGNLHRYYEFQCSPLNVVRDLAVTSPNASPVGEIFDGSWDCTGWNTAVSVLSGSKSYGQLIQGWGVEWRLPLGELLAPGMRPVRSGDEWRVNLFRIDRWPVEEYSSWSATPGEPFTFHRPAHFGRWIFG